MMHREPCRVCEHPERRVIDKALAVGQPPRSIIRRYAGLNRKALVRHRDEGHHQPREVGV